MEEFTADNIFHRIKAVQTIEIALPSSSARTSTIIACTVSSDGKVNLYDIAAISDQPSDTVQQIEPLTTYDSKGTRLTCLTLADGDEDIDGAVTGKRKRENNEEEDEDDHEDELESGDQETSGAEDDGG